MCVLLCGSFLNDKTSICENILHLKKESIDTCNKLWNIHFYAYLFKKVSIVWSCRIVLYTVLLCQFPGYTSITCKIHQYTRKIFLFVSNCSVCVFYCTRMYRVFTVRVVHCPHILIRYKYVSIMYGSHVVKVYYAIRYSTGTLTRIEYLNVGM